MIFSKKNKEVGSDKAESSKRYRVVRFIYALLAIIFLVCIVLQVFLAGAAIFSDSSFWAMHKTFVVYFEMIPVVMFLFSFMGGIRGKLRWFSLGLYVLISFQHMTVQVFSNMGLIAALHPVVALLLFWCSLILMKRSWHWLQLSKR